MVNAEGFANYIAWILTQKRGLRYGIASDLKTRRLVVITPNLIEWLRVIRVLDIFLSRVYCMTRGDQKTLTVRFEWGLLED